MQVDYALILSAGLGTRMGELGKVLPKVLWPIFSKSLLQLQIDYCKNLGIRNIYINVHFLAEEIIHHLETIDHDKIKITVLREDPLLDSGGAIHNLARRREVNYRGNLLMVNADQFLFFEKDLFDRALQLLEQPDVRASLFGFVAKKNENYNETVLADGVLIDIQKNKGTSDYVTYSGLGILKLDGLAPVAGISKFFQSVVNYKLEKANMITLPKMEYWDFGTAELYSKNIFRLASDEGEQTLMKKFLSSNGVGFVNCRKFLDKNLNSIDLEKNGNFFADSLCAKNIKQKI